MTGKVVIEYVGSLAHGANPAKYVMHATGLPASVFPQRVFSVIFPPNHFRWHGQMHRPVSVSFKYPGDSVHAMTMPQSARVSTRFRLIASNLD